MNHQTTGEIRPSSPSIRPNENIDQTFNRLTAWTLAVCELLEVADRHVEQPDARNPERLRIIAATLADVSAELDGIADTLAASVEGHRHG